MAYERLQRSPSSVWNLAARQHGVVARHQLLALGFSDSAIKHGLVSGRLHPARRGVYAVGRPELSLQGRRMAAVLACGPWAALSHASAAALWGIRAASEEKVEVSVPVGVCRYPRGVVVHRRTSLRPVDLTHREGIQVTAPNLTLLDLSSRLAPGELEAAINEADKLGLTDPEELREALEEWRGRPGVGLLRATLDRRTFTATDSELERRFLPLAGRAGLPPPQTGCYVTGYKVDFYWPDLGLVVETDGLRYHRTPAQQARDRLRDQAHAAAGLTPLRFTHSQVFYEPGYVQATLASIAARLQARPND